MLTSYEEQVLAKLGDVWTSFACLPNNSSQGGHDDDREDFRYHIRRLQDLIAARPAYRSMQAEAKNGDH